MLEQIDYVPDEVKTQFDAHNKRKTHLDTIECIELLHAVAQTLERVFIIVDALDESTASAAEHLLDGILQMPNACILNTSRENPLSLGRYLTSFQKLEIEASIEDVKSYARARLSQSEAAELLDQSPGLMDTVLNEITQKAGGMYEHSFLRLLVLTDHSTGSFFADCMSQPWSIWTTARTCWTAFEICQLA